MDLFVPTIREIWLDDVEIVKSPVNGPAFVNFPWRGVVHTTEISRRVIRVPERPGRREDPDPE